MKPSWDDAMPEMKWLVQEDDGAWWFSTVEPIATTSGNWTSKNKDGWWQYAGGRDYGIHEKWNESKEPRP